MEMKDGKDRIAYMIVTFYLSSLSSIGTTGVLSPGVKITPLYFCSPSVTSCHGQ